MATTRTRPSSNCDAQLRVDTSHSAPLFCFSLFCALLLLLLWGYLLVSVLGLTIFPFAFTCIPLCFTEPAPQFEESAEFWRKREREGQRERCHSVCHSLFTLPFLGVATKASWQSASRFVVPFIASSHLTPPPVLSLSPLACHDSVTLHLHLHAVNCCNSNWTSRPSVYMYVSLRTYIHIFSHPHNWTGGVVVFVELSLGSCTVSCFLLHTFK